MFSASLKNEGNNLYATLADDMFYGENMVSKIVEVRKSSKIWVEISIAQKGAKWSASISKLLTPSKAISNFTVSGSGTDSAGLYRLDKGTYQVTTSYSGNVDTHGEALFIMAVAGTTHELGYPLSVEYDDLVSVERSEGTATRNLRVSYNAATYWFDAKAAAKNAEWSITVKGLKNLTTAPTPKISGTAKTGKTLKAVPGTWKPSGVQLSYQWYRGNSKISGATKSSYKLISKDKGKTMKVKVAGAKTGYVTMSKTSKLTSKVK